MPLSPVVTLVELRPRRIWFVLAALVAVNGVLVAAGVMLFVLRSGGDLGQRITPGQPVTVYLSPSDEKLVWAKVTSQGVPDVRCPGSWVDDQTVRQVGFQNLYLTAEEVELEVDDERWRAVLALHGEPGGRYEVTCTTSGASPTPILSIGDPPRFYNARDTAPGSPAAFGLATISVIIGAVLAVVVAIRRAVHRARLRQQQLTDANRG